MHIAFSWGSRREKYAGGIFLGGIACGNTHYHRKTQSFYIKRWHAVIGLPSSANGVRLTGKRRRKEAPKGLPQNANGVRFVGKRRHRAAGDAFRRQPEASKRSRWRRYPISCKYKS